MWYNVQGGVCFLRGTAYFFMAIFRGLFLLEVRILPAARELREAYVFPPHVTHTSWCELNQS